MVLFAGMATARWLVLKSHSPSAVYHSWLVAALFISCWLYPFYTLGLQRMPGLFGNIATLIVASCVVSMSRSSSLTAASLTWAVVACVVVATVYIVQLIRLNP